MLINQNKKGFLWPMVIFFCILAIIIPTCSAYAGTWTYVGDAYKSDGVAVLTQNQNGQTGATWSENDVFDPFDAQFWYKAGGGTGADGMVFMFYKKNDNNLQGGGNLGFSGSGYGIEFDSYISGNDPKGKHVALIKDSVSNHLAYSWFNGVNDNKWHKVYVDVGVDSIQVYIDGSEVLTWEGTFNKGYGNIGFSAATGALNDWHEIRDVVITPYFAKCVSGCVGKGDSNAVFKKDKNNPKPRLKGP